MSDPLSRAALADRRIDEPVSAPAATAAPAAEPRAAALLALQRSLGNQAVTRMLAVQRQAADEDAGADPEIEDELDEEDEEAAPLGPEDDLLAPDVGAAAEGGGREPAPPAAEAPEPFTPVEAPAGPVLARRVVTPDSTGAWRALPRAERDRFLRRRFRGRRRRLAARVLADMVATTDDLRFDNLDELYGEVFKRVTASMVMQTSQERTSGGNAAFGYPFSGPSLLYGPRVNYAARNYWQPKPPDDYAVRRDRTKNRTLRSLPRNRRHEVYGDMAPGTYEWELSALGRANPYEAIDRLFIPQAAHRRTLIHCDYLISLVHFQAFAGSIGRAAFNARVASFGPERIRLKWNAFADLEWRPAAAPLGSLQVVHPATEGDLVIGDHVYFWNHEAYDLINARIGNAWRLENALLVDRRGGTDYFLGHGSGRRTSAGMRSKLAEEYNDVADVALRLTRRAGSDPAAAGELSSRFPNVSRVGPTWRVRGRRFNRDINVELRRIRPDEVLALRDPYDPARFYGVRRPVESR